MSSYDQLIGVRSCSMHITIAATACFK